MSVNTVAICGNLTRDVEVKYSAKGTAIATFSIAWNEYRKAQDGEGYDQTVHFFNCVMFGRRAEGVSPYLTKGKKVTVQGRLTQNRWEQDGQPRSKVEIRVDELDLGSKQNGGGQGKQNGEGQGTREGGQEEQQAPPGKDAFKNGEAAPGAVGTPGADDFDDDIPF